MLPGLTGSPARDPSRKNRRTQIGDRGAESSRQPGGAWIALPSEILRARDVIHMGVRCRLGHRRAAHRLRACRPAACGRAGEIGDLLFSPGFRPLAFGAHGAAGLDWNIARDGNPLVAAAAAGTEAMSVVTVWVGIGAEEIFVDAEPAALGRVGADRYSRGGTGCRGELA